MIKHSRGFGLLEIVIAIAIMGVLMIPVAMTLSGYVRVLWNVDSTYRAMNLISREAAITDLQSYTSLAAGTTAYTIDGFYVSRTVAAASASMKYVEIAVWHDISMTKLIAKVNTRLTNVAYGIGTLNPFDVDSHYLSVSTSEFVPFQWRKMSITKLENTRTDRSIVVTGILIMHSLSDVYVDVLEIIEDVQRFAPIDTSALIPTQGGSWGTPDDWYAMGLPIQFLDMSSSPRSSLNLAIPKTESIEGLDHMYIEFGGGGLFSFAYQVLIQFVLSDGSLTSPALFKRFLSDDV